MSLFVPFNKARRYAQLSKDLELSISIHRVAVYKTIPYDQHVLIQNNLNCIFVYLLLYNEYEIWIMRAFDEREEEPRRGTDGTEVKAVVANAAGQLTGKHIPNVARLM